MRARNIEIKARCADLARAEAVCQGLGARWMWTRRQTDVYFAVPEGRLKLRTEEPGGAVLVSYRRADRAAARESQYELLPVANPRETLRSLESRHGVAARVEKTRALWLLENVRIHLDRVEGLGAFIEFEALLEADAEDAPAGACLERLQRAFGIAEGDLLAGSYADMVPRRDACRMG